MLACGLIHLSSLVVVLYLCGVTSAIACEDVKEHAPQLHISTTILQYFMLALVVKDILV